MDSQQAPSVYHDCQQRMIEKRRGEVNDFMAMLTKSDEGKEHLHPNVLYRHINIQSPPKPTFKELWKGTEEYTRVLARFRLLNA
jgi:hypothetical protein